MSEVLPLVNCSIMASPGQKKGACGHIMASFDKHSRCARCREKGQGDDPCVQTPSVKTGNLIQICDLITAKKNTETVVGNLV